MWRVLRQCALSLALLSFSSGSALCWSPTPRWAPPPRAHAAPHRRSGEVRSSAAHRRQDRQCATRGEIGITADNSTIDRHCTTATNTGEIRYLSHNRIDRCSGGRPSGESHSAFATSSRIRRRGKEKHGDGDITSCQTVAPVHQSRAALSSAGRVDIARCGQFPSPW